MFLKAFIICSVLFLEYTNAGKPIIKFSETETKRIFEAAMKCLEGTNFVAKDILEDIINSKYHEDRPYQEFFHCTFKNANYIGPDGHVNLERAVGLFPKDVPIRDVLSACHHETGKDEVEAIFNYYKCFQINAPVAVDIS